MLLCLPFYGLSILLSVINKSLLIIRERYRDWISDVDETNDEKPKRKNQEKPITPIDEIEVYQLTNDGEIIKLNNK